MRPKLVQEEGKNPVFELGVIEVSREWLDAVLKTLVQKSVIPGQLEVNNLLQQAVVKSLL